jgi:diguanylate cyclase (GGDEF)-like protein
MISDSESLQDLLRQQIVQSHVPVEQIDMGLLMRSLASTYERYNAERFDAALEHVKLAYYMVDADGRVSMTNALLRRWLASPEIGAQTLLSAQQLYEQLVRALGGLAASTRADAFLKITRSASKASLNLIFLSGQVLQLRHSPVQGGGFVHTLEDVTERRKAEALANHRASYDMLTNLPNRRLLKQHIDVSLNDTLANCAVMCVAVNRFKSVNESLGHSAGDALLVAVASRLSACVRSEDTVGRLGGNEFVILMANVLSQQEAAHLAERVIAEIGKPFEIQGHSVVVAACAGIALAPQDAGQPDRLIKLADLALFAAKREGAGHYRFFEPDLELQVVERKRLEQDLRQAVERKEFELHYQPVFCSTQRTLIGCEALIRWNHPTRGRVPPLEFIPLAEELGLITPLGDWIIDEACRTAVTWPAGIRVAVNVSARQFVDHDLVGVIRQALENHQLAPDRLEVEITESLLMESTVDIAALLQQVRELGVGLAMDDFGTGYSSLAYLRKFHFSKVKIDRSFVSSLPGDMQSLAIIRAIVALCKSLGLKITAEGVETEEQADVLQAEQCDYLQGFGLGKPMQVSELAALFPKPAVASVAASCEAA